METFDSKVERIKELADNPEVLSAHVSNHIDGITEHLPNVSQSLSSGIMSGLNYLNSKIPRPNAVLPMSGDWEPSVSQKQKFDRHYEAVDNPIDILNKIKDGSLTSDHMEALQAAHPVLLKEMQQQLMTKASPDIVKTLPKQIKQGISMFLCQPLSESDLTSVRIANQAVFQSSQQLPSNQAKPKSSQKGLSELKVSNRAKTQTDREEISQP